MDSNASSENFNSENNLAKYLLDFNESLQNDRNNAHNILRTFYSKQLTFQETDLISQKLKNYQSLKDMSSWKSSLESKHYKTKKVSSCNKLDCPLSNISKADIQNLFSSTTNTKRDVLRDIKEISRNGQTPLAMKICEYDTVQKKSSLFYNNKHILNKPEKDHGELSNCYQNEGGSKLMCIDMQQNTIKDTDSEQNLPNSAFKTAREELLQQSNRKRNSVQESSLGNIKKTLGTRRTTKSGFVAPWQKDLKNTTKNGMPVEVNKSELDDRLNNIDPKMIELINNEVINNLEEITWDDIAGLGYAKSVIRESIIWPILRPDIFTGIRRPPKGILFFGPPGTGKTLIGKCIASQSKSKFFSISASSLTSKWIGEGEKMVRALFAVACVSQPAVIFIDEIDSLLCKRTESEHESSRRLKTEFLVQLDGAATSKDDRVLIIGATNRPQELDDAARRRFVRRLYIPLPDERARILIIQNLLKSVKHVISDTDFEIIGKITTNYSGADIASLCQEACMKPLRAIPMEEMSYFNKNNVRAVILEDFQDSVKKIKPSVSTEDLNQYLEWNELYGCTEIN